MPKHTTIVISFDANGNPRLVPPNDECYDPNTPEDPKACGWTKFKVEWVADEGVWWKVVFAESPFNKNERHFESSGRTKATIKIKPQARVFPYTFFYERKTEKEVLTPKIVIRDTPFFPPRGRPGDERED